MYVCSFLLALLRAGVDATEVACWMTAGWSERLGWCVFFFLLLGLWGVGFCCLWWFWCHGNGNLLYGIWEGVASDVSPAGVPLLKDMYVGDEDAVSIPSDKYLLCMACRWGIHRLCCPRRRRRIRCCSWSQISMCVRGLGGGSIVGRRNQSGIGVARICKKIGL